MLKRAGKFYYGVLTMLAVLVIANVGATQFIAHGLNYHTTIGTPLFAMIGYPIYPPLYWVAWLFTYSENYPEIFNQAYLIFTGIVFVGLFLFVAVMRTGKAKPSNKFGSARWATEKELKPFDGHSGIILGAYSGTNLNSEIPNFVTHNGPEHVCLVAPSRSGKGATTIIPTLFRFPESVLVLDIKGENWEATSGWRSKFTDCFRFDPANPNSAKWNPLQEIRTGSEAISDADLIASMLVDPDGVKQTPSHWDLSARSMLKAFILHCRYTDPNASLASVKSWLKDPKTTFREKLNTMMETTYQNTDCTRVVHEEARSCMDKAHNELSSIKSTVETHLNLYDDPILAANTSQCDFRINDIMNSDRPVSLYIVFTPSEMERLCPFIRLFLTMTTRLLTNVVITAGKPSHKRRCLMLLDEFARLKRLSMFHEALGYLAGYGLPTMIVVQSINDIKRLYGINNSILENCAVQLFHASNDPDTADHISRTLGITTQSEMVMNRSGHILAPILTHTFVSNQENSRPLLTPGEVMQLGDTGQLLMSPGRYPAMIAKMQWWTIPFFQQQLLPAAPHQPKHIKRPENPWTELTVDPSDQIEAAGVIGVADLDGNSGDLDEPQQTVREKTQVAEEQLEI
jgi:type IV secretion system protein VirD4